MAHRRARSKLGIGAVLLGHSMDFVCCVYNKVHVLFGEALECVRDRGHKGQRSWGGRQRSRAQRGGLVSSGRKLRKGNLSVDEFIFVLLFLIVFTCAHLKHVSFCNLGRRRNWVCRHINELLLNALD